MIKAIILDWHGVLDFTTFSSSMAKIAKELGVDVKVIMDLFQDKKTDLVMSPNSEQIFWDILESHYELTPYQKDHIAAHRNEIQLNQELFAILEKLSSKYTLAVLSDCPPDKAATVRSTINLTIFKEVIFSCEVGMTKQTPALFNHISQLLRVTPADTLYVDDSEKNVRSAESLGYRAIQFKGNIPLNRVIET